MGERGIAVTWVYTRQGPIGWRGPLGRLDRAGVAEHVWPPDQGATFSVCGPTGFVEATARALVELGHDPERVRTERLGGAWWMEDTRARIVRRRTPRWSMGTPWPASSRTCWPATSGPLLTLVR